jgi:hypothetical protein
MPADQILTAHRCNEHHDLAPMNRDAVMLVVYAADRRPTAYPLLEVDAYRVEAECGGCLGEQVEALYQINLDLLDLIADLLLSRAQLRHSKELQARFLV